MKRARNASIFPRLICWPPPNRPPNSMLATPNTIIRGKIEYAPLKVLAPEAKDTTTMPTTMPMTPTATTTIHHGLGSGGGTFSGAGE